jgi:microcystin-dependent protein
VRGALQTLINPDNWEKYGDLTPDESADAMLDMFDQYCAGVGVCRMIGEIILWAGSDAPSSSDLLLCDGSHVSNEDYPDLWGIIGTSFGGTGATDFALPDLQTRVPIGSGTGYAFASAGGEEQHTLIEDEIPSHSHIYTPPIFNVDIEAPGAPDPLAAQAVTIHITTCNRTLR